MLFDPKWETKTDPLSLEALIEWLEKQPQDKTYCYTEDGRCLAAQYNQHIGRQYTSAGEIASEEHPPSDASFDSILESIAIGTGDGFIDWTFGAALSRARFIQANDRWPE